MLLTIGLQIPLTASLALRFLVFSFIEQDITFNCLTLFFLVLLFSLAGFH